MSSSSRGSQITAASIAVAACPGISSALVGTPFEVIKTRLQTQRFGFARHVVGPWCCLKATLKSEGFRGLWRGVGPALMTSMPYSMTMFSMYQVLRPSDGNLFGCALAGSMSGLVVTLPQNPLEYVRVRLQAHRNGCIRRIWRSILARPQRVFSGISMTACINFVGMGIMFPTNETLKKYAASHGNFGLPTVLADACTGGITGLTFKLAVYPADLLRSRMMACGANARVADVVREVVQKRGVQGLYQGASVIVVKAFCTNAAGWSLLHAVTRNVGL